MAKKEVRLLFQFIKEKKPDTDFINKEDLKTFFVQQGVGMSSVYNYFFVLRALDIVLEVSKDNIDGFSVNKKKLAEAMKDDE